MAGVNFVTKIKFDELKIVSPDGTNAKSRFANIRLSAAERNDIILSIVGAVLVYATLLGVDRYTAQLFEEAQMELAGVEKNIATEKQKFAQLKAFEEEASAFEVSIQTIRAKLAIVESASKNRNYLVRAVDFMIQEMPKNVWMSSLDLDLNGAKASVKGNSLNMQFVGDYMIRLAPGIFFQDWTLMETRSATTAASTGEGVAVATTGPRLPPEYKTFEIEAKAVLP